MPWCDGCDRYYSPNTVQADGSCPTCGTHLDRPTRLEKQQAAMADLPTTAAVDAEVEAEAEAETGRKISSVPWHFWVLVVALVIYLGWRLAELIVWLVGLLG